MEKRLTTIIILVLSVCFTTIIKAQNNQISNAQTSEVRLLGKTEPLRDMAPVTPNKDLKNKQKARRNYPKNIPNFEGNIKMPHNNNNPLPQNGDPLYQTNEEKNAFPVIPLLTFEGMDVTDSGSNVPDPVGDIGKDHYIQSINAPGGAIFEVFDKEGNSIYGPTSMGVLWEPLGAMGLGDPIILYDQEADRWLLTEFGTFSTNIMLVAVSETGDPLGSWHVYEFQAPSFPDYPKYAVWNNAYYVTTNEFSDANIPVYALEREAMLEGSATAQMQRLGIPKFNASGAFQMALPVEWDGVTPPDEGEPGHVVRIYDDAWDGGNDRIEVWKVYIDWSNENNSYVEGPTEIPLAPFDACLCDLDIYNCIEQPTGVLVSALEQVTMFRAPYRKFSNHESIVLNFSVDVNDNNHSGIRWVELRRTPGSLWELYQEGTHAPDEDSRFMGSIAMDGAGNILLGYSVTGEETFLSTRYTGRLSEDPLGQMTIDEYEVRTGEGIQFGSRWGDYACMTVDPANQLEFWFTGEYMQEDDWATVITKVLLRKDSNDIGVTQLISPENSGYLTDSETVKVEVKNFGYKPQSAFGISYQFEGEPIITEMVMDTLLKPDSVYLHTFTPTVDLEEIGLYNFKLFTTLATDTAYYNDTLRTLVAQLPRNDAAIAEILGTSQVICDTVAPLSLILINGGVDTLESVNIYYELNEDPPILIEWTGQLPSGETDSISLILEEVVQGDNTITSYTELPNGVLDEAPQNDTISRSFYIIGEGITVTLELLTDDYPNETQWELTNSQGEVLFSGGPYNQAGTLFTEEFCLEDSCYTFTIFDSYGDGLLGFFNPGSYRLTNEDGIIVASIQQINFGFVEVNEFCSVVDCSLEAEVSSIPESTAAANDGYILIEPMGGVGPYEYSIDGGETFQSSAVFTSLDAGEYEIIIRDFINCETTVIATVETCNIMLSVETTNASTNGSSDGTITVTVTGGIPPFQYSLNNQDFQPEPVFENLPAGQYGVYVIDSIGCSPEILAVIEFTTGTNNNFFGQQLDLHPNPTDGFVQISLKGYSELSTLPIAIFNSQGQIVKRERLVRYGETLLKKISLHELPSGTYFIKYLHPEIPILSKVIKE